MGGRGCAVIRTFFSLRWIYWGFLPGLCRINSIFVQTVLLCSGPGCFLGRGGTPYFFGTSLELVVFLVKAYFKNMKHKKPELPPRRANSDIWAGEGPRAQQPLLLWPSLLAVELLRKEGGFWMGEGADQCFLRQGSASHCWELPALQRFKSLWT